MDNVNSMIKYMKNFAKNYQIWEFLPTFATDK